MFKKYRIIATAVVGMFLINNLSTATYAQAFDTNTNQISSVSDQSSSAYEGISNDSIMAPSVSTPPPTQNEHSLNEDTSDINEDLEAETPDKTSDAASDDSSDEISSEPVSYDVSISGICLLDYGSYAEVGAAYETADPDVEFRWLQYDLQKRQWTQVSDWNKGNWITWKLDTPGDYWIYVEAKTSSGQTATSVYGHRYKGRIVELGEMIVIDRGDHYDVGVNYKTNDTGLTFRWLVYDLQKKIWTTITDNTKSNWISHSFEKVGYYWITVQAIDSDGNITSNTAGITYKGPQLNLNGICYLFQDNRIDVGVAYDCTDPNVEFQWMAYNLDTKTWELISEWNTGNWTSWTPEKGNYWLNIQARTSDGTTKNKTISFHVSRTYKFNISGISPVEYDDKIVLNAEYANGSNPVIFKWLIRDLNNSMWETLSDWTYQEYAVWNPEIGDYEICLQAADRTGNLKTYTINYHVTNNCAIPQPEATILRVGKAEEFTTINDAIINAIEIGVSENNPIRILIESGYYNEQIILDNIHGLSLEGEGCDNTIIEYAGSYPDCVIHASGDIQFSNLTIRETGSTYAVHVDPVNTGVGGRVVFSGCSIQGGACAIGYGSGIGTEVHLINCELMGSKYVIYAHNSPFSGTGQKLVINGCSFIQTSEMAVALFDDAAYSYFRSSSPMVIIASNNTYNGLTQGTIAFRKDTFSGEVLNYIPDNEDNILLSPDNGNNSNILGLDY